MMGDTESEDIPYSDEEARWSAVVARDVRADERFVYAVRTTGVYCRPSCSARTPSRRNVSFYDTVRDAEAAGFRPCRRCRPNEPSRAERQAERVSRACRLIEEAETAPSLEALATAVGMSPFHFHRVFRGVTGITPKAYADARRAERLGAGLRTAESVTQALYAAGYNTPSRFYAGATERLGMTPGAYRQGGLGMRIRFAVAESTLGMVLVAATERGVCAILLGDEPDALVRDLEERFPKAERIEGDAAFADQVASVVGFVEAPAHGLDLPLDIGGTVFQQRVWAALRAIPVGTTATYAEIARAIGEPAAVRAVAMACGANRLAVAIPCHRVVRSDGTLSGYRWGVGRKRELLTREGAPEAAGPAPARRED